LVKAERWLFSVSRFPFSMVVAVKGFQCLLGAPLCVLSWAGFARGLMVWIAEKNVRWHELRHASADGIWPCICLLAESGDGMRGAARVTRGDRHGNTTVGVACAGS
jgi:hypothetical protein